MDGGWWGRRLHSGVVEKKTPAGDVSHRDTPPVRGRYWLGERLVARGASKEFEPLTRPLHNRTNKK